MQKIFITGANGQLGRDLIHELTSRGITCIASDIQENFSGSESCEYMKLDITDYNDVEKVLKIARPDRLIHCAAWTAVDLAEDDNNKAKVFAINVTGTENIARVCSELNIVMTYISTDYVFNGEGVKAWQPDDESFNPVNYYGFTKLQGEFAVKKFLRDFFIVRIAWAFGKNPASTTRRRRLLTSTLSWRAASSSATRPVSMRSWRASQSEGVRRNDEGSHKEGSHHREGLGAVAAEPLPPRGREGRDEAPDRGGGREEVRRARPRGPHGQHEGRREVHPRHPSHQNGVDLEEGDRDGQGRRAHRAGLRSWRRLWH